MNRFELTLWEQPFSVVKSGLKTIEMRLNTEKRQVIQIGDIIEFTNIKTNEKVECLVKNKYCYKSFEELYKNHDKKSLGYKEDEIADYNDMLTYYKQEDIDKYGVVGIEIELLTK